MTINNLGVEIIKIIERKILEALLQEKKLEGLIYARNSTILNQYLTIQNIITLKLLLLYNIIY